MLVTPVAVTKFYFDKEENRQALATALKSYGFKRHVGPDELTKLMSQLADTGITRYVHIPHFHQVTDFEGKTIAEILRIDAKGNLTLKNVRSIDLLQLLSLCMQLFDKEYAEHVKEWCHRQVLCLDERDEDF